jgi:hypothetical protein
MSKILIYLVCAIGLFSKLTLASETETTSTDSQIIDYKKVITEIPKTSIMGLEKSFSKESIPDWIAILSSTAVLYNNDEVILRDVQRSGRDWGIGNDDNTRAVITAGDFDIIRLPTDIGSAMYFLGDGWIHGGIAAGFLINGYSNHNSRAANTGLQLAHGMIVSTMFNQFLKRSFGRQSPYVKTEYLGKWSPYPSIAEYQAHTSKYDAMPSGHVMTTTLVFTIINENYPEYSNYIIPIGVTWTSILAWQMVNNGVHWAADYPLGIAMGFVFGKASTQLGKTPEEKKTAQKNWMILPNSSPNGEGLTFLYSY